jgi:hypothetical protein
MRSYVLGIESPANRAHRGSVDFYNVLILWAGDLGGPWLLTALAA